MVNIKYIHHLYALYLFAIRSSSSNLVKFLIGAEEAGISEHPRGDPAGEPVAGDKIGEPVSARLPVPLDFVPVDVDVGQVSLVKRPANCSGVFPLASTSIISGLKTVL